MALKDLVQTTDSIEKTLENILKGRVKLLNIGSAKAVHLETELLKKLDKKTLILLYLAGKWAWQIMDKEDLWVRPKEFEVQLGISGGTIRPYLVNLAKGRLIELNKKESGYRITAVGVSELEQILANSI